MMERTILLLDGHDGVRAALTSRLRHTEGVGTVAAAKHLVDALTAVRETPPDAVIYDPHTVDGDAAEAIRRLAENGRPVIVLTSSLVGDEAEALHRAGATAILLKGSNVTQLLHEIERAIEASAQPRHESRHVALSGD
jgi:two-component system invasion response regulator UvrY